MRKNLRYSMLAFVFAGFSLAFSQSDIASIVADSTRPAEDRGEMHHRILAALKPGGVYGIIDDHAQAGAGSGVIQSLHRIEQDVIVEGMLCAGFTLAATADILSNSDDDRSLSDLRPEHSRPHLSLRAAIREDLNH